MAELVYSEDSEIKDKFNSEVTIGTGEEKKLKWFIQKDKMPNRIWLSIRGTVNITNIYSDLTYSKTKDKLSGIYLHKGFAKATKEIYGDIKKSIDKNSEIHICGHSLGGAAAVISMIWLKSEGYNVKSCYTFGQPKVTNSDGRHKYKNLPLIRIINKGDPVPNLPAGTPGGSSKGEFRHFGDAVILHSGKDYVYLEGHDASRRAVSAISNQLLSIDLDAHKMENYMKSINKKVENCRLVLWK